MPYKHILKICPNCKKEFYNRPDVKTCSKKCTYQYLSAKYIPIFKNCPVCGKMFKVKKSHFNKRITCSIECMAILYKTNLISKNNPNYKDAGRKTCKNCGNEYRSYNKDRKFCSNECWGKYTFGQNYGYITSENTLIRYSTEYKKWRSAVFARDHYRCVICHSNKNIQADHIKPFAYYPELRFDVNNGRTLCKSCHLKTDTYGGKYQSKIQEDIIKYITDKGYLVMVSHNDMPTILAHKLVTDDVLAHNHGIRHESVKLVYLEVKIPGKSPTPLQKLMMTKLQGYGAKCYCVHSVEEVMQLGL